ncbi:hypothetical protein EG329_001152 [Mollisiaceae sp. DMI_Dod_QoI]|nr:hypothetical protein EG329_001152 [Helotiales sp. DMI_Dod_QoI]
MERHEQSSVQCTASSKQRDSTIPSKTTTKKPTKHNAFDKQINGIVPSSEHGKGESQLELWAHETRDSCLTMTERLERSKWEASCLERL